MEAVNPVPKYNKENYPSTSCSNLKRHRDMMFNGSRKINHFHIIITTLALKAYNKETSVIDALTSVIANYAQLY